ncbi:hypothetical protein MMPV_006919 [Pyropia vietnamensis]
MSVSPSLLWHVIRTHTCKTVKRNGIMLSREKGNLRCMHTYRDSGISNFKSVNIVAVRATAKGKKTPTMDLKNIVLRDRRKPNKMWHRNHLKKGSRRAIATVTEVVKTYRPDLQKDAAKRMDKVLTSLKVSHKPVKKGRRNNAI